MTEWISIDVRLPDKFQEVLFCCFMEDVPGSPYFTDVSVGWYEGQRTLGDAIAMETLAASEGLDRDWSPCTHWMPLPKTPEIEPK